MSTSTASFSVASMMLSAVNGLFAALGEEPDETLSAYLISMLQDEEALDFAELKDIVAGFSPSFDALPDSQQHGLLVQLVKQGRHQQRPIEREQVTQVNMKQREQQSPSYKQPVQPEQQDTVETNQPNAQQAEADRQQAATLLELYPGSSPAYLNHVLHNICHDRLEDAAHWLMDQDNLEVCEADWHARQEQLQRDAEEAARQEKINRKKLLEKYHLQAVPISAQTHIPTQSRQGTKSKNQVRYREGVAVTAKGEKYVLEKVGQDWDGGSTGKVVTKGKRGKGFV